MSAIPDFALVADRDAYRKRWCMTKRHGEDCRTWGKDLEVKPACAVCYAMNEFERLNRRFGDPA